MQQNTGARGGCILATITMGITLCILIAGLAILFTENVRGAELPNLITDGRVDHSMDLKHFGTYSTAYYRKRWARMCKGGGRYVAMAEAYDMGLPQPCK
jgi:hypothetical protein